MDSSQRLQLEQAARLALGEPLIREMSNVDTALRVERWAMLEVLVLLNPDHSSLAKARAAADGNGLPRWAIVVFRTEMDPPDLHAAPMGDAVSMARALVSALKEHEMEIEREILRGNLWSIGRRVAHDLRTPLGGIVTSCEALNETLAGSHLDAAGLIKPILESAEGMERLLERTSFLARACGTPPAKTRFNMESAFWTAFQLLEAELLDRQATLVQPQSWPEVAGVDSWLGVIWFNLLANSLRHAGTAPRIEAGWRQVEEGLRFWVKDSGPGVPFEKQHALFFPFYRMHEPSAPRGLGLPMVRCLVEAQRGTCGYEPVEGGGGIFSFTLPADG